MQISEGKLVLVTHDCFMFRRQKLQEIYLVDVAVLYIILGPVLPMKIGLVHSELELMVNSVLIGNSLVPDIS